MRDLHRRDVICGGLKLLTAIAVLPLAAVPRARAATSCVNPDSEALRDSLHYTDTAADPAKACKACGFFTAEEQAAGKERASACGNCMIFTGPVSATGHCDSWSMKS